MNDGTAEPKPNPAGQGERREQSPGTGLTPAQAEFAAVLGRILADRWAERRRPKANEKRDNGITG